MPYCPKCGNKVGNDDAFCSKCGTAIVIQAENSDNGNIGTSEAEISTNSTKNKGLHILIISLIVFAISFVGAFFKGPFGAAMIRIAVVALFMTFASSILCIKYSRKCYKHKGQIVGIIIAIVSGLLSAIVLIALVAFMQEKLSKKFVAADSVEESRALNPTDSSLQDDIEPSQDENDSEIAFNESSEPISESSIVSTDKTEEYKTDWDNFECIYFGDIPVGLLTVPDTTLQEVEKYVNERLGLSSTLEIHEIHNVYMAYQVELDNVFNFYGYSGQAVFEFDWDETLSNIVFEFDTESGITPEVIQQIHNDLDAAFDSERAWMLDEQPDWGVTTNCFWNPEYDGTPFKIRLTSMFSKSHPTENEIEFERTVTRTKMNDAAAGDIYGGKSDSVTQNGLTVRAIYHDGKNPYVSGSITNHSDSTVKFIRVKVALLDSSGSVMDTTWTYAVGAEGLGPDETSQWEVFCSEASSIEVSLMDG